MYRKVRLELICIILVHSVGDFIYTLGYVLMWLSQEQTTHTHTRGRAYVHICGLVT
jgi:hypothetical protein